MEINLSRTITKLNGGIIKERSIGNILAHKLMDTPTVDPTRLFVIAVGLLDDRTMEISEKDYILLKKTIEDSTLEKTFKEAILMEINEGRTKDD